MNFKLTGLLLSLFLLFSSSSSFAKDITLVFSAIPDQNQSQLKQRFDKIADYLSSKLNIAVKYVPVKSYAAAITAFRNNQVRPVSERVH